MGSFTDWSTIFRCSSQPAAVDLQLVIPGCELVITWLGLDPNENHHLRSRAIAQRLFGGLTEYGSVEPIYSQPAASEGLLEHERNAHRLFDFVKDMAPTSVLHFLDHFPAESTYSRLLGRHVATSYLLQKLFPTHLERPYTLLEAHSESTLPRLAKVFEPGTGDSMFHINDDTNYLDLMSAAYIVSHAFSDFALIMCRDVKADFAGEWKDVMQNKRSPAARALLPFQTLCGLRPELSSDRLAVLEAIDRRLDGLSKQINDHKGGQIQRSKAKDVLLRFALVMKYMHAVFGNRSRLDKIKIFDQEKKQSGLASFFTPKGTTEAAAAQP